MARVEITGRSVDLNEEGYLTDCNEWCREIGEEIAGNYQIELTDKHWEVIDYLRDQYQTGSTLNIRRIGKSGVVDIKTFYKLFPGGPLKVSSKIAGIPKPASCI